eukprot:scaffold6973_cov19-Tisochrysis_lutea.AAC.1
MTTKKPLKSWSLVHCLQAWKSILPCQDGCDIDSEPLTVPLHAVFCADLNTHDRKNNYSVLYSLNGTQGTWIAQGAAWGGKAAWTTCSHFSCAPERPTEPLSYWWCFAGPHHQQYCSDSASHNNECPHQAVHAGLYDLSHSSVTRAGHLLLVIFTVSAAPGVAVAVAGVGMRREAGGCQRMGRWPCRPHRGGAQSLSKRRRQTEAWRMKSGKGESGKGERSNTCACVETYISTKRGAQAVKWQHAT